MIRTYSCLGILALGLSCALACSQKDPNDGLDGEDTTSDTTGKTTTTASSTTKTTAADSDTTQTSAPTDASNSTDETDSDTTDATEQDSGTSDTDTTEDSSSSDTTEEPNDDEICPMVAGATWTYEHTDWTEVQTVTATDYEGDAAFLVKDTPDPDDNLRADTVLVKRDGRVLRLYKEQIWVNPNNQMETLDSKATYGVGFLRCDEAWASKEPGWSETPEYIRIETVGTDPAKAPEDRSHTFTVEGREDISTSNGKTYSNCVVVLRSKDWQAVETAEDATEKRYWFCPGVGKVREQNVESGKLEELVTYSIP